MAGLGEYQRSLQSRGEQKQGGRQFPYYETYCRGQCRGLWVHTDGPTEGCLDGPVEEGTSEVKWKV